MSPPKLPNQDGVPGLGHISKLGIASKGPGEFVQANHAHDGFQASPYELPVIDARRLWPWL